MVASQIVALLVGFRLSVEWLRAIGLVQTALQDAAVGNTLGLVEEVISGGLAVEGLAAVRNVVPVLVVIWGWC